MDGMLEVFKNNPLAAVLIVLMAGNTGFEFYENRDGTPQAVAESQIALLIYRVEQLESEIKELEAELNEF